MVGPRAVAVAFLIAAVGGARADVAPTSDAFQRCSGRPEITQCYIAAGREIVD